MADYINQELQRILGNPENEIVSESLRDRLKPSSEPLALSLNFDDESFDCSLDSFSKRSNSNHFSRISILLSVDATKKLLTNNNFRVVANDFSFEIVSSEITTIDCFRYDNDNYILELSIPYEEILND
jgi:hypothetical protein